MTRQNTTISFTMAVAVFLSAILLYDVMGAIVKHLSDAYSTQQLTVFRNLFGLIPALALLFGSRAWAAAGRPLLIRQWPLALMRGCLGVAAQLCFYLSLIYLELATAATLVFASPLFVTALSVPVLRHRIGLLRWCAVGIGFLGVLLILRPGQGSLSLFAVLPVLAALGYASTAVTAKLFDRDVPTPLINLYYSVTALLAATLLVMFTGGFDAIVHGLDFFWLAMMGIVGGVAALCMTSANRMADPSSLSPFQYFGIPSSFMLGWLFFAEAPVAKLIPGVFLIVAGGLIIIWRERAVSRV